MLFGPKMETCFSTARFYVSMNYFRIARSTQWPYLPEASDKPTSGTVSSTRASPSTAILVATFYFHLFLRKHEIGMSTRLGIAFDGLIMT